MRRHPNPRRRRTRGVIHYATGYGVKVTVSRGHLVVADGIGSDRHTTRYNRATGRLRRLVVVASTGYISFEAVRWLQDAGCQLVQLDHSGRVLATSTSLGVDQPALRRAQARAAERPVGLEIARRLLTAKLEGQRAVAQTLDADAADQIGAHLDGLAGCGDMAALRLTEAHAAAVYWAAWRGVQARFVTRDIDRVPAHWTRFSQRGSLLTGAPRVASDPMNCCLNWLYGLLEAESRLALLAVGLDPGLGLLHSDQPARDSLALDLMEAARPAADGYLLRLLADRPLRRADFAETSAGQCRLMSSLAQQLTQTMPTWAGEVAPYAELIACLLARDAGLAAQPTLLTGETRRAARPGRDKTTRHNRPRPPQHATVCAECGAEIPSGRKRCPSCHATINRERLSHHQVAQTAQRRQTGEHPSRDPAVRERISRSQHAQWASRSTASSAGGYSGTESEFRRLIQPRIANVPSRALVEATGLSPGYCAQIRDGRRVPDVRHWAALQLVGLTNSN